MIPAGKRNKAWRLILFAGLFALSCLAAAASTSWELIGPAGGSIQALAVNPKNPSEVFAVTSGQPAQIFRTTDGATSWRRVAVISERAFDIALDSVNPAVVYALGASSIYRSNDGGASWLSFAHPVGSPETGGAIVVSPGEAGVLYVAGRKDHLAVAKSLDWGENWTLCCSGISPNYGYAVCAAANPKDNRHILVGGFSDGSWRIYRTTDGGQTWASVLCSFKPLDIAFDPFSPPRALAATTAGIYKTTDGGGVWTRVNPLALYRLTADPLTPNRFFGGYDSSSYRSADGGTTWSGTYDTRLGACTGLRAVGERVCFTSNLGIFVAPTSGGSWQSACAGLQACEIKRMAVCPTVPNIVYVADKSDNLLKTNDFGESWTLVSETFRGVLLTAVLMPPALPPTLYMASFYGAVCGAG